MNPSKKNVVQIYSGLYNFTFRTSFFQRLWLEAAKPVTVQVTKLLWQPKVCALQSLDSQIFYICLYMRKAVNAAYRLCWRWELFDHPFQMSAKLLHHETPQKTLDLSFIVTLYENLISRYQTHVSRIFSTLNDIGSDIETWLLDSLWDKGYFCVWTFVPRLYNVIKSPSEHKMYKKHLSDSFFVCLAPSENTSTIYSSLYFTVSCSLLRDIYHEVH